MTESHQVAPESLRAHAATIRGYEDRVNTAVDAASHVAGLDEAYGVLCRPFGAMVSAPQSRGVEALTRARDVTRRLADNLDVAADAYEESERSTVEKLDGIGRSIDATGPVWEV